jgi:catechol 2,3-dioxygenase-like lactoylglutathione lyase family enzyme
MKRFHIAIGVADISRSIDDYTRRLGCPPSVVVPDEYALWRTSTINLSIRRASEHIGTLRHLGWEDSSAPTFATERDVNGIVWEHFSAEQQTREILETWPHANYAS